MQIKQIQIKDLHKYHKIPMLKEFDYVYAYASPTKYTKKATSHTIFDMAKEESIEEWLSLFNKETCGVFVLEEDNRWVGGCVVVTKSPKVGMMRKDFKNAVLWDIRVHPDHQGKGFGKILLDKAIDYGKKMDCNRLLIETQNNNPSAIGFYEKQGAKLIEINRTPYPDYPEEDQLIFEYIL